MIKVFLIKKLYIHEKHSEIINIGIYAYLEEKFIQN